MVAYNDATSDPVPTSRNPGNSRSKQTGAAETPEGVPSRDPGEERLLVECLALMVKVVLDKRGRFLEAAKIDARLADGAGRKAAPSSDVLAQGAHVRAREMCQ
jgi:hypothetical protein